MLCLVIQTLTYDRIQVKGVVVRTRAGQKRFEIEHEALLAVEKLRDRSVHSDLAHLRTLEN